MNFINLSVQMQSLEFLFIFGGFFCVWWQLRLETRLKGFLKFKKKGKAGTAKVGENMQRHWSGSTLKAEEWVSLPSSCSYTAWICAWEQTGSCRSSHSWGGGSVKDTAEVWKIQGRNSIFAKGDVHFEFHRILLCQMMTSFTGLKGLFS